jgi:hypothetical protein
MSHEIGTHRFDCSILDGVYPKFHQLHLNSQCTHLSQNTQVIHDIIFYRSETPVIWVIKVSAKYPFNTAILNFNEF